MPNLSLQIAWCRRIYRQNTETFGVEPRQVVSISNQGQNYEH